MAGQVMDINKWCGPEDYARFKEVLACELNKLRIVDIKVVLTHMRLAKSGNKAEMMQRIENTIAVLNSQQRFAERDSCIEVIRNIVQEVRGFSQLPTLGPNRSRNPSTSIAAGTHGGSVGGGGSGGETSSSSFMMRLNVGNAAGSGGAWGGGGASASSLTNVHALAMLGRTPTGFGAVGGGVSKGSNVLIQCVCGQNARTGDEVVCSECNKVFHNQCYGISMRSRNKLYPARCFLCLSLKQNPFYEVIETIVNPTRISRRSKVESTVAVKVSMQTQTEVNLSRRAGPQKAGILSILVRCFPLNLLEMVKPKPGQELIDQQHKPPYYPTHCWPLESQLLVNNLPVAIKQRQVYFCGVQRKWKGQSEPVDIYNFCRSGINRLTLVHNDPDKHFVLLVQVVRSVSVEQLQQRVISSPDTPSAAESLERICQSFKACSIDSDGEGETPMATVTRLSLRCPLGLTHIQTPARGKECQHLQCFDLGTFLRYNERGSAAGWKCGVCHAGLTVEGLQVDAFMRDILEELKERRDGGEGEELDSIQINDKGEWKLFNSSKAAEERANNRKRKAEVATEAEGGGERGGGRGEEGRRGGGGGGAVSVDVDDDGVAVLTEAGSRRSSAGGGEGGSGSGGQQQNVGEGGWEGQRGGEGRGGGGRPVGASVAIDLTVSSDEEPEDNGKGNMDEEEDEEGLVKSSRKRRGRFIEDDESEDEDENEAEGRGEKHHAGTVEGMRHHPAICAAATTTALGNADSATARRLPLAPASALASVPAPFAAPTAEPAEPTAPASIHTHAAALSPTPSAAGTGTAILPRSVQAVAPAAQAAAVAISEPAGSGGEALSMSNELTLPNDINDLWA